MTSRRISVLYSFLGMAIMLTLPLYSYAQQPSGKEAGLEWSQDKGKTWIQLDEPIPEGEKDKKWPWLPAEKFPFKAPYTGDELAWFTNHSGQVFSHYCDTAFLSMRLNKRGHLIQRAVTQKFTQPYNWNALLDYEKCKVGEIINYQLQVYFEPPEKRGSGLLSKRYQQTFQQRKTPDIWIYVPSLRRNRRVGISDREDCIAGSDISYDDLLLRQPWDSTHTIIGTDVIYETANRPLTVDSPDKYPWNPYREDGGVECYVVREVHKDPKYYLTQRIVWYEKTTKMMLRDEQYDRAGDLMRLSETAYLVDMAGGAWFSQEHHDRGLVLRCWHNAWSIQIDHQTYGPFVPEDVWYGRAFSNEVYNPLQLLKEEEWRTKTKVPYLKSAKEFIPRPPLYRDKFPKYRKIVLPEELEKKLEAHK
ncbi:MAG: outer membrane lipoprotein-sorting protein [Thermodesulfobacteriota bacterium]|nr:outer membrane lipoprotein-sorting protein [Thermodesulfobacteriota bacterium]